MKYMICKKNGKFTLYDKSKGVFRFDSMGNQLKLAKRNYINLGKVICYGNDYKEMKEQLKVLRELRNAKEA